jgi:hypothetical protein
VKPVFQSRDPLGFNLSKRDVFDFLQPLLLDGESFQAAGWVGVSNLKTNRLSQPVTSGVSRVAPICPSNMEAARMMPSLHRSNCAWFAR